MRSHLWVKNGFDELHYAVVEASEKCCFRQRMSDTDLETREDS
jgi:hypothetical protein